LLYTTYKKCVNYIEDRSASANYAQKFGIINVGKELAMRVLDRIFVLLPTITKLMRNCSMYRYRKVKQSHYWPGQGQKVPGG
jgi:hypothetical protein